MFIIFKTSLIIAIILTTGVYITGYVDQRQLKEFGYIGARFLILSYVFIYSLINLYILLNIYSNYVYDAHGFIITVFIIFTSLVCIGIVHTDTKNSIIEYFYNYSPLKRFFKNLEKGEYDK